MADGMKRLLTAWLCLYNQALGLSWLYVLCHIVSHFALHGTASFHSTWDELEWLLWRIQLFNLCDVVHALAGVWPAEPEMSLMQRLWCKCGHRAELFVTIYLVGDTIQPRGVFAPMIFTWAMADVSRYQLYFFRTLGASPPTWLRWLRYSDFLWQWPLNLAAEGAFVLCAIPRLISFDATRPWQSLVLSFVFSYAPIALANQVGIWTRFPQGYTALRKIRARRLQGVGNVEQDACCAIRQHTAAITRHSSHRTSRTASTARSWD